MLLIYVIYVLCPWANCNNEKKNEEPETKNQETESKENEPIIDDTKNKTPVQNYESEKVKNSSTNERKLKSLNKRPRKTED